MKIRPLHDRVLVKREEEERKTASGIVLPDSASEKPNRGEIIAAGPGKSNDKGEVRPMGVKVGDTVLFSQYAGAKVKVEGDELLMMGEDDILAVIED
ncbi:co-chaperone GroES [Guyparkeria halopsychrophila]|jgi:chaperonin GroES|uniref:co-chaperone GroES n=1 Tax=Guyparkeria halopsychrophila TaxID=3139421 RepID=UPI0037C839F7